MDPALLDRLIDKEDAAQDLFDHLTKHNYDPKIVEWVKDAMVHKAHVPVDRIALNHPPTDPDKVARMVKELRAGDKLPRVLLADTGKGPLRIADGHHRVFASAEAGLHTIRAYVLTHVKDDPKEPWRVMHDQQTSNEKKDSEGQKKAA